MNWKNTSKHELPLDEEEVFISINGVYNVAIYHANQNGFEVKNSQATYLVKDCPMPIYWSRIENSQDYIIFRLFLYFLRVWMTPEILDV
jgi:hypothetical protein